MKIRILTGNDLMSALPMPEVITAMRLAFSQLSAGEAGDIIMASAKIDAELGEIINGLKPGRRSQEITSFKSVGVAVQDTVAAVGALEEAESKGLGTIVEL